MEWQVILKNLYLDRFPPDCCQYNPLLLATQIYIADWLVNCENVLEDMYSHPQGVLLCILSDTCCLLKKKKKMIHLISVLSILIDTCVHVKLRTRSLWFWKLEIKVIRGILSIVPFDQAPYEIQWLTTELNLS